jgi:hypothetical protein
MFRAIVFSVGILAAFPSLAIEPVSFDERREFIIEAGALCQLGSDAACISRDKMFAELGGDNYCSIAPYFSREAYFINGKADEDGTCTEFGERPAIDDQAAIQVYDQKVMEAVCASESASPIPQARRYYKWLNEAVCGE